METGWLIERTDTPAWLCIEDGNYTWTADSLKAMRFCRKEDAEQLCQIIPNGLTIEHQWG